MMQRDDGGAALQLAAAQHRRVSVQAMRTDTDRQDRRLWSRLPLREGRRSGAAAQPTRAVPTMPWPARKRDHRDPTARTFVGRWFERRRLRHATRLQFKADRNLPQMSGWSQVIARLLIISPGVADVEITECRRGEMTVRVRLSWWTWITFGLMHWSLGRTLVRHRALWCPVGWTVTVVIA